MGLATRHVGFSDGCYDGAGRMKLHYDGAIDRAFLTTKIPQNALSSLQGV